MWKRCNNMSIFILKRNIDARKKKYHLCSFLFTLASLFSLYDYNINIKGEIYIQYSRKSVEMFLVAFISHLRDIVFTNIMYNII